MSNESVNEEIAYVKKSPGRPKKENKEGKFDKKAYMKKYMKVYNQTNKGDQLHRRNTSYYIKKFNIEKEFVDKYGIYTASMYKCFDTINKVKNDCPLNMLKNIKEYIDDEIEKIEKLNV